MCSEFTTFNLFNRLSQRDETEKSAAGCGKMEKVKKDGEKRLSFCLLFHTSVCYQVQNVTAEGSEYILSVFSSSVSSKLLDLFMDYTTVFFFFQWFYL